MKNALNTWQTRNGRKDTNAGNAGIPTSAKERNPFQGVVHDVRLKNQQLPILLPSAFKLMYLVCKRPDISSYELSRLLETRQMTCWKFKKKLIECLEDNDSIF
jgi:hypothetical protein